MGNVHSLHRHALTAICSRKHSTKRTLAQDTSDLDCREWDYVSRKGPRIQRCLKCPQPILLISLGGGKPVPRIFAVHVRQSKKKRLLACTKKLKGTVQTVHVPTATNLMLPITESLEPRKSNSSPLSATRTDFWRFFCFGSNNARNPLRSGRNVSSVMPVACSRKEEEVMQSK